MLARTADDIFWLSRYLERAEHISRLVEVACRFGLMPREGSERLDEWRAALAGSGVERLYLDRVGDVEPQRVTQFLLFDPANPSSVHTCLHSARHNGRAQRTALTQEMWESLNATWIEFAAAPHKDLPAADLLERLDFVKQRVALYRGARDGTSLRNDMYRFSQIGTYLERADNTCRILGVRYPLLLPQNERFGGRAESRPWNAILRSVSAHSSYRWVFHEGYRPVRIAEFLILNAEMPRSLAFACHEITAALSEMARLYGSRLASLDMAEGNLAWLTSHDILQIFRTGLSDFLLDFGRRTFLLGQQISEEFHFNL